MTLGNMHGQEFARDLRALFVDVDALDMGPLMRPGADIQAAAASMASDAGVNSLLLRVCLAATLVLCCAVLCHAFVQLRKFCG